MSNWFYVFYTAWLVLAACSIVLLCFYLWVLVRIIQYQATEAAIKGEVQS